MKIFKANKKDLLKSIIDMFNDSNVIQYDIEDNFLTLHFDEEDCYISFELIELTYNKYYLVIDYTYFTSCELQKGEVINTLKELKLICNNTIYKEW